MVVFQFFLSLIDWYIFLASYVRYISFLFRLCFLCCWIWTGCELILRGSVPFPRLYLWSFFLGPYRTCNLPCFHFIVYSFFHNFRSFNIRRNFKTENLFDTRSKKRYLRKKEMRVLILVFNPTRLILNMLNCRINLKLLKENIKLKCSLE